MLHGNRGSLGFGLLLAVALALGIERLVVTDEEAVDQCLKDARALLAERDFARLRPLLSDDFVWEGLGPDEALALATRLAERNAPLRIELTWGPIVVAGARAEVEARLQARLLGSTHPGDLRLVFAEEPGGWKLVEARR